ncbi:MAG: BlaI/MecI/CopY family transcriptional regulator [Terriglobales bacterium]
MSARAARRGAELPQLELDCLVALWRLERAPVAAVHAALSERGRPLAYTTVLTVMERLLRKGVVERRRQGRAFQYAPLITRVQMRERALERLVTNYFDSRQELERYLMDGAPTAPHRPPPARAPGKSEPVPVSAEAAAESEPALLD